MMEYDVIVIGGGSGSEIVNSALSQGLKVAMVDRGPLGGTCLNFGCIPSKMLIYPADRVVEIKESEKLGIKAEVTKIDFQKIMKHMRKPIEESHEQMKKSYENPPENFDYYQGIGHFVDNYVIKINNQMIKGKKIFIGTGARPFIPPIKGIEKINYLTNENVFDLKEKPKSLIIVGGGYIGIEFAHFFQAMGTDTTVLQRSDRLIPNSEPEISEYITNLMSKRMNVVTNFEVASVEQVKNKIKVFGTNKETKKEDNYLAEKILIATGRKSNSDLLKIENTDIETDDKGYIKVNEYLETNISNIWAFGDANGKYMFKHVANEEAIIAWNNSIQDHKHPMDYSAVPYAVFTYPQIASVGMTETEARKENDILVGKAKYSDVAMGEAMAEQKGFAKAIVDKESGKILGYHIIGPYAPILIQEVINAMALGGEIGYIGQGMHIHPALPELVLSPFQNLEER